MRYLLGKSKSKVRVMQHIVSGYRGISILVDLNWDRLQYLATIGIALGIGAFIGSF